MFAMCRRTVNTTAAAAAVDASSCRGVSRQCANARIAITMDAALLASIFVALIGLLGILSLSLLLVLLALCLILRGTAVCPKDPHPCLL